MKKWFKIIGFTIAGILVLIVAVISVAVWILTPARLTPLVQDIARKNLDAEVNIGRVKLSFWSTFPRLEVDIDNLEILSNSLDRCADSLPEWRDSLLSLQAFHGALSLPKLVTGTIAVDRVSITRPAINLVTAADGSTNYDIVKPSESESSSESSIPSFSLGRFAIAGDMPVRYLSVPDSTYIALTLSTASLEGEKNPVYTLDVKGDTHARLGDMHIDNLRLGLGGDITWNPEHPAAVKLNRLRAALGDVTVDLSTDADFSQAPVFNSLNINLLPVSVDSIVAIIPTGIIPAGMTIGGDARIAADIALTEPYRTGADIIPSLKASLNIEEGTARFEEMQLKKLSMKATAVIDGHSLDKSELRIGDLFAVGEGVGFRLSATVTNPLSDPYIKGTFKGGIVARWLSRRLLNALPCKITGDLRAECDFAFRRSYLTPAEFHRVKFNGDATLNYFHLDMRDASANLFLDKARLKLGSDSRISIGAHTVDSLLTASLEIDSIAFFTPGLDMQGRDWKMGVGMLNVASTADTTMINPIGGRITAGMLSLDNEADSARIRLRDATVSGSLTRFRGNKSKPRLSAKITSRRAIYSQNFLRAFISDIDAAITVFPAPPKISRRTRERMDSIAALYPTLPPDSVYARAMTLSRRRRNSDTDSLDHANSFNLDGSTVALLKKWGTKGHVKAGRIGVFTPMFPIRNVISELDMKFSSDSLIVSDTRCSIGRSRLTVNGSIANISRSLTSRRGSPIILDFNIKGDTLDVNRIATAMFAGIAYQKTSQRQSGLTVAEESEAEMQRILDKAAENDSAAPVIIPMNIDAGLNLDIRNVLYSDLTLNDVSGMARVSGGALNLRGIRARTDMGAIDLNALYSAPDETDMRFAFGMLLKDFRIDRFLKLMPSIDSVMPLLNGVSGIINADIAATSQLEPDMNINIPSLSAAVKITGDSLVLLDSETFRKVSKWLLFKNKKRNMIDHMEVEMVVDSQRVELFPFIFDMDRYRLGIMGSNDLALNFKYHVAVLKSPVPFKFGINISGNPDKMKIRLGGAKLSEKKLASSTMISDTTRINLVRQIESAFIRGVRNTSRPGLNLKSSQPAEMRSLDIETGDTISRADSLVFIREGLIDAPLPPDSLKHE
ncbi:MAG: AsmA family protein [Duncaniella sp.]|nr:AsmA family protein [Duncaniella sp.]